MVLGASLLGGPSAPVDQGDEEQQTQQEAGFHRDSDDFAAH